MKCFSDGWRNSITGLIYYNASTQTYQQMSNARNTSTAVAQTAKFVDVCTNTNRDAAVQVHCLPDLQDRSLMSRSSATIVPSKTLYDANVENYVVKIQRYYRAYRARRLFHDVAVNNDVCKTDESRVLHLPIRRNTDITLLNYRAAKSRKDFDLFYNMLNRWQMLELERASRLFFKPSRIAAYSLILSKKVQLLRQVDAMKTVIKVKRKEWKNRKFLNDSSKLLTWKNSRGELISMDTQRAQRAREHRETYELLSDANPSVSDRARLLCAVKQYTNLHSCCYSVDLARLIDQELSLLRDNADVRNLMPLRNRVRLSFLRLARTFIVARPEVDHPITRPRRTRANVAKLCRTCGRLVEFEKFSFDKRFRVSSCCYCAHLKTAGEPRVVYEPYERMLRELRRDESRMSCCGGPAFVVRVDLVYRLVNSIWLGKSGISECADVGQLRLVRFYRQEEWSPWNCILLTKQEAAVHRLIENLQDFYGSSLLQKIKTKNLLAKLYFEKFIKRQTRSVANF